MRKLLIFVILALVALVASSTLNPGDISNFIASFTGLSCSDQKVVNTLRKIYIDRMPSKDGSVEVHNISTVRKLDNGGGTCNADLEIKGKDDAQATIMKSEYSYERRDDNVIVTSRLTLF